MSNNINNNISNDENLHNTTITKNVLQWEPIKRNISYPDFVVIFDRVERVKHVNQLEIDTDTGHKSEEGKMSGKGSKSKGKTLTTISQIKYAVKNLKKFILETYNIELIGPQTNAVQLCHLCKNNCRINKKDSNKHTCTNPSHVYFGTAQENNLDRDPDDRKNGGRIGGKLGGRIGGPKGVKTQIQSGTHNTQVNGKCPHCLYETKTFVLGNHIPACRFNPNSQQYLKPLKKYQIENYQKQGLGHKIIELELMINENYNLSYHQ